MNGGGDDEFSFRIQPKALILDVDRVVPSAGFALAWRINDGKKQAVSATMRGPASKIRADGKFFIDLSTMEPIRFTQRFRIEPGTVSRLEPHSLQIKVYRVTFKPNSLEEDTRERLYQRSVDLRTLLKRAGVTYSHSVELDDRLHHSLEIEYTVQLPDDEIELRAIETPQTADAAVVLPTPQFDDSRIPRSEVGNVWESISTRFDQARLDTRSELQVCSISQMVADSTRRDVDIPDMTLPLLFNLMFADKAPFPALVHNERQNAKVVEGHWSVDESETFASREDKYSARFGEHYNASEDVAFLFPVVVGAQQKKQFFKIAVIRALDAVMLDGVRLQVVTSIQESSTGCSVSFLAYPHFLSRALAFSGKGKATKLLDKLLNASTAALKKLTNAAQRSAQGDGGQAAGRPEMIHFDLWVRLADGNSADVVDYMLQRLCVPTTTPLPTDELKGRLYALDSILCRYRTHAAITARIMTYLDHLIDVHGASEIVRNSCIVDVVEHLERIATTAINRRVVLKLTQARDSGRDDMVRYIRHAQDPWECLSHPRIFVDAKLVLEALARRPTVTRDRIPLLTCIMGMHATEVDVFDAVVTLCAENTALFVACADAAFHDALRTGLLFHPEVAFRRRDCVGILRANVATPPPTFASPFAAFIVEEVRFSCDAKLLDTDGKITVFVTSHFICFGDKDVFPLASLVPGNCRTFRSGFTPAVELHFVESSVSSAATMTTADVVAAAYVNTDATVRIATHKRPSLLSILGIVIK